MSTKQTHSCPALFPILNEVNAVVNYILHCCWAARKPHNASVTKSSRLIEGGRDCNRKLEVLAVPTVLMTGSDQSHQGKI